MTTEEVHGAASLWDQSGLDISLKADTIELEFGSTTVHPGGERRTIDQVLPMMSDPNAKGPEHLYTIYMDVCNEEDFAALQRQGLLYGAVVYNYGSIGAERLRSQGHIHSEKAGTGLRYSEVYEFWTGHGFVYLQKECAPEVSRALLIPVGPGDKVIVPLGWVHLTVAAADEVLSFGAWCARANKLEYHQLRALGGPAHFLLNDGTIVVNPKYDSVAELETVSPRDLPLLGLPYDEPIYTAWQQEPGRFDFLPQPELVSHAWDGP